MGRMTDRLLRSSGSFTRALGKIALKKAANVMGVGAYRYRGRGLYTGRGRYNFLKSTGNFTRALGKLALKKIENLAGVGRYRYTRPPGPLTKRAGVALNSNVKRALGGMAFGGRGAYYANNLVSGAGMRAAGPASFRGSGDETGAVTVSNTEYIGNIFAPGITGGSAVAFDVVSFALNPGLERTFPWLSQIAANYEEYEFKQLVFKYKSTTLNSLNSSTGQIGTIVIATNYNANARTYTDVNQMKTAGHMVDGRVTDDLVHGIECQPSKNPGSSPGGYVRTNPVVNGEDLKSYDKGKLQIGISNSPAAFNGFPVGELTVDYTVTLRKPRLYTALGRSISRDIFYWADDVNKSGHLAPDLATNTAFTNALLVGQQNNIGCVVSVPAAVADLDGVAVDAAFKVTFPASYAGLVKLVYTYTLLTASTANNVAQTFKKPWENDGTETVRTPILVSGNITPYLDCFFGLTNPTQYPTWQSTNTVHSGNTTGGTAASDTYTFEWHLQVQQATLGADNSIICPIAVASAEANMTGSSFLEVVEYNPLNDGATAQAPLFVNNVGVITSAD